MVMNSEPSGTDADIPEGESAIDVFILCKDDRDSEELCGQLAPQGYRVTLFSDSADLVATLRTGKPNLLICDATGPGKKDMTFVGRLKLIMISGGSRYSLSPASQVSVIFWLFLTAMQTTFSHGRTIHSIFFR